jgi:hypothetical protein
MAWHGKGKASPGARAAARDESDHWRRRQTTTTTTTTKPTKTTMPTTAMGPQKKFARPHDATNAPSRVCAAHLLVPQRLRDEIGDEVAVVRPGVARLADG